MSAHAQSAGLTISKLVSVNGLGFHLSSGARPGDTLMYHIYLANSSSTAATNITVTDYLQAGQTPLTTAGAGCTYDSSSRVMTCTVPAVGAKSTVIVEIVAAVDSNFRGTLYNTASMSGAGVPTAKSNQTAVFVGPPVPVVGPATFIICGTVTAYGTTSITVAGAIIPVAANAEMSGSPIVNGSNMCLTLTMNSSGQVTALAGTANLPGVPLVCGVYSAFTPGAGLTRGVITLGGIAFPVEATVLFPVPLVVGQLYCFVLSPSGVVNGILSSIPTAAWPVDRGAGFRRIGREWLQ
jgi:uncharacterized repeat protein (TIGR01451 family)